jgi:hypothetical protein
MESDDDRHPLPEFTFHEACLLTLRLISQGLPDLHVAPAATVQEELQLPNSRFGSALLARPSGGVSTTGLLKNHRIIRTLCVVRL